MRRIVTIQLADIDLSDNTLARMINAAKVGEIAESFRAKGQQTPVIVGPKNSSNKHPLFQGFHRVAAAKQLNLITIQALVWDEEEVWDRR